MLDGRKNKRLKALALRGCFQNAGNESVHRSLYFAFPRHQHTPSQGSQGGNVRGIAGHVRSKLVLPEFSIGRRCRGEPTPLVAVPKATVHKDDKAARWEHDVGAPRKIATMKAKTKARAVQS